jgi:hypothetical protein
MHHIPWYMYMTIQIQYFYIDSVNCTEWQSWVVWADMDWWFIQYAGAGSSISSWARYFQNMLGPTQNRQAVEYCIIYCWSFFTRRSTFVNILFIYIFALFCDTYSISGDRGMRVDMRVKMMIWVTDRRSGVKMGYDCVNHELMSVLCTREIVMHPCLWGHPGIPAEHRFWLQ